MRRAAGRIGAIVALSVAAAAAVGCGGVAVHPPLAADTAPASATTAVTLPPPPAAHAGTSPNAAGFSPANLPAGPGVTPDPRQAVLRTTGPQSAQQAITDTFHTFTYLLSGLDDNLNSSWLPPLTEVTTERMAQAITRQASAMLRAHERGVGALVGRNLTVKITGSSTAALADCEDYSDFYLVDDGTGSADPGIVRGHFVGTAQLIKTAGRWYVDVYATTQTSCG